MLSKLICLWTLCVLPSVLLEGEGSPVLKGSANAIKGNVELNMIIIQHSDAFITGQPHLMCLQDLGCQYNKDHLR